MMQGGSSPSFPLLGLHVLRMKRVTDLNGVWWVLSLSKAECLSLSPFLSFSVGPGGQRKGAAEHGHHVLGPDRLTLSLSEQDGSPGPIQAILPHYWWGESLISVPPHCFTKRLSSFHVPSIQNFGLWFFINHILVQHFLLCWLVLL